MSLFYYFHYRPDETMKKLIEHYSLTPHEYDYGKTGYFSDTFYHSRNANARFYIVTFGYEEAWPRKYCPPRTIDRYHMHFVFEGEGKFNGQRVHAGQIFIAPPNRTYEILHSSVRPMKMGWIGISGKEADPIISALHLPQGPVLEMDTSHMEEIREIFLDTVYRPHPDVDLSFFLFGRAFDVLSLSGVSSSGGEPSTSSNYTHNALNFINTHYMKNISVSDIAKSVRISESYLRSLFLHELGISPSDLIMQKRIAAAKAMLRQLEVPIAAVADSCGYSDRSAFSKRFKEETGMTPGEYRERGAED